MLSDAMRMWWCMHRATGRHAKRDRAVAIQFGKSIMKYRNVLGIENFKHLYPETDEEIENLMQRLR